MADYSELLDEPPPRKKRGWWRYVGRHLSGIAIVLMIVLLIATVLFPYVVITVPSGQVGVLWKRFIRFRHSTAGALPAEARCSIRGELREEGLHIIWPWDKLFLYNLRLQSDDADIQRHFQRRRERRPRRSVCDFN